MGPGLPLRRDESRFVELAVVVRLSVRNAAKHDFTAGT